MSIEAIVDKIIEDAQKQAKEISNLAETQASSFEEKEISDIKNAILVILENAKTEAGKNKERQKIASRMEIRKLELEEKQKAITLVVELAIKEIKDLDKAEYQKFVEPQFLSACGDEEILIPEDEKRINEEFIEKINKALSRSGKKGCLKLSKTKRNIPGGGFILKKDNIEYNNSIAVMLDSIRNKVELKISEILFEKDDGKKTDSKK